MTIFLNVNKIELSFTSSEVLPTLKSIKIKSKNGQLYLAKFSIFRALTVVGVSLYRNMFFSSNAKKREKRTRERIKSVEKDDNENDGDNNIDDNVEKLFDHFFLLFVDFWNFFFAKMTESQN